MTDLPPLRYLAAAEVSAAMPPLPDRLRLAETTLRGLAGGAEQPPKVGLHPTPPASFAHAMPARLPGDAADGSADLVGMKWIAGNPANSAAGLANIHALLLLNDPVTTVPVAILDAGPITAERAAAISGVVIRAFAPAPAEAGGGHEVALVGAGVQGRSHLAVIGHVLPGAGLTVFDRDPARAEDLAAQARATPGIARVRIAPDARACVERADVVVTAASFAPREQRQAMTGDWLAPHALVVPVDYETYCSAEVARDAVLFAIDHLGQFRLNRDAGEFAGFPDPHGLIGAFLDRRPAPAGRIVAMHLGTGLADVILGSAILEAAVHMGLGTMLRR